jgi:uncharacterized membrane protein
MVAKKVAYCAILTASVAGCFLAVFPPLWIHLRHDQNLITRGIVFFFSGVCHQIPDRSFHFWGEPAAVCARCLGLYAGFLAGTLGFPLVRKGLTGGFPSPWIFYAAAMPAVLDFTLAHLGLVDSGNLTRAFTGLLPGVAASFYLLPGIFEILTGPFNSEGYTCKTNPAS